MREKMPDRRACWTQKARIENQPFYLTMGEYPDGRLGEIFIEAHMEGTFTRGVLTSLARVTSVALQCGAPLEDIVAALGGLNFPPYGMVSGSPVVNQASSISDWIAQELSMAYLNNNVQTSGQVAL